MIFNIKLSPVASLSAGWDPLSISKVGSTISVNGNDYDLSTIPDGATLPNAEEATGCKYFSGYIIRDGDMVYFTLILPHDNHAPEEARFPEPLVITQDGVVELPNVFEPKLEPKEEEGDN